MLVLGEVFKVDHLLAQHPQLVKNAGLSGAGHTPDH